MNKKLYKSSANKKLCGVCAGIAEYFDVDVTLVRLIYAFGTIFTAGFFGVIAYCVAAAIMPEKPFDGNR